MKIPGRQRQRDSGTRCPRFRSHPLAPHPPARAGSSLKKLAAIQIANGNVSATYRQDDAPTVLSPPRCIKQPPNRSGDGHLREHGDAEQDRQNALFAGDRKAGQRIGGRWMASSNARRVVEPATTTLFST